MTKSEKVSHIENNRVVREEGREFWDQESCYRYYLQDYIGKTIRLHMRENEKPYTGVLIEAGRYDVVMKINDSVFLVAKHAIESVELPKNTDAAIARAKGSD